MYHPKTSVSGIKKSPYFKDLYNSGGSEGAMATKVLNILKNKKKKSAIFETFLNCVPQMKVYDDWSNFQLFQGV